MAIQVATAPVSWGALGIENEVLEYTADEVLDGIKQAGFAGTELGPYGFYPSDPEKLRQALAKRGLRLTGAFFWDKLADPSRLPDMLAGVRKTASLISQAGASVLVLCDYIAPERCAIGGRVASDGSDSWTREQWGVVGKAVRSIVDECRKYGLRVAFHNHVGTYIERPEELDRVLELASPDDLGLCLDTGHYAYAGGDPAEAVRRYGRRLEYIHLKDINRPLVKRVIAERIDFNDAVAQGIFVPIGQGIVSFERFFAELRAIGFDGWVNVEQDVIAGPDGKMTPDPLVSATTSRNYLREKFAI